jgi:alkylation response protein AidB-like acyl-CoA dehydrogenase
MTFSVAKLPEGAAQLRMAVRSFLKQEIEAGCFVPGLDTWLSGWNESLSTRLGARGWIGLTIPTKYGGAGRSSLERYVVAEELLAAGAPVAAHWMADRQIAPSLLNYGTEEQRRFFLPRIAAGICYFAVGMSEPGSGSDLASVLTHAERDDRGWRISGTKIWTSGAQHAQWLSALARNEPKRDNPHSGLSQFIVDLGTDGVEVRPIKLLTGATDFNEVVLDGVFVPDEMVLGKLGDGWRQVTGELAFERSGPERFLSTFLLLPSLLRQHAQRSGADANPRSVSAMGAMVSRLITLREMSLSVAAELAVGEAPATKAALVKNLSTQFEQEIADMAPQIAAIEADPGACPGTLARALADAALHSPGFTLRGGTNEILRGVVARSLVGR